jgi:acyl transferase domain-containing protein
MGHSIGEYVAACVAGVIDLEDALVAVAARGRLMQSLPAGGAMAAVFADAARVRAALSGLEDRLAIAAVNAPENTVISGAADALEAALATLAARGVSAQRLEVSHAFHSPLMEPMLDAFEREIASLTVRPPRLPIVSNLTGEVVPAAFSFDASHWRKHAREAVRFTDGVRADCARTSRAFLEVGPTPTLGSFGRLCGGAAETIWVASLRRPGRLGADHLSRCGAYVNGGGVGWEVSTTTTCGARCRCRRIRSSANATGSICRRARENPRSTRNRSMKSSGGTVRSPLVDLTRALPTACG